MSSHEIPLRKRRFKTIVKQIEPNLTIRKAPLRFSFRILARKMVAIPSKARVKAITNTSVALSSINLPESQNHESGSKIPATRI